MQRPVSSAARLARQVASGAVRGSVRRIDARRSQHDGRQDEDAALGAGEAAGEDRPADGMGGEETARTIRPLSATP